MKEMDKFFTEMLWCKKCNLHRTRFNVVVGDGNLKADILVVGEAPGANEDVMGVPFCGRSGKLLRELFKEAGIEDNVYITNIVKCRPPDNREPSEEEMAACIPYLQKQFKFLKPKAVIGVGRMSSIKIKGDFKISEEHGKIYTLNNGVLFMGIYHPAYLLRNRSNIEETKNELKNLNKKLKLNG